MVYFSQESPIQHLESQYKNLFPPENNMANNKTQGQEQDQQDSPRISDRIQAELDKAVETMRKNLSTLSKTGEGLETLQSRTADLGENSAGFRRVASRRRRTECLKDMRMRLSCLGIGIILLIIIIVPIIVVKR
jgi:hypothetical protein